MKRVSEIITIKEIEQWEKGNLVFINAGTGTGKTYFIKNTLSKYCDENKRKILYLTNRDNLKKQIKNDIGDTLIITVINYQKVEARILHNVKLDNYDYVVMDEGHYFFTDAAFSRKTDLFFKWMLNNNSICKIIMTATPRILLSYFDTRNIQIDYKYELKTNYSYLNKIIAFNNYESIDSIIEDIPKNEQILLFSSAKRAYEISEKHKGTFICSENNKNGYDEYINYEELTNIIETSTYKSHLLCTTTTLDNGINIKEFSNVKHIIIDIFDRDTFLQCLGRRRIGEGEKINLYFYSYGDNKKINGFKKKKVDAIERANYLLEYGKQKYVERDFKNDNFVDTRIIDEIIINGEIDKVVNECMYTKFKTDLLMYDCILNKEYSCTYKSIIALELGIDKEDIIEMEVIQKTYTLEEALESVIGQRLFKDQQKELVEFIGLKDARGRLQRSISLINEYLKVNKLNYIIISKKDNRKKLNNDMDNPTRGKQYWEVIKTIIE